MATSEALKIARESDPDGEWQMFDSMVEIHPGIEQHVLFSFLSSSLKDESMHNA